MSNDKTAGEQSASGCRGDVLLVVDSATLLERYPDASLSADAPTPIDGNLIYILAGNNVGEMGRNDSRLELALSPGKSMHVRGITLALGGEQGLVLYRITLPDASVLTPPKLVVHNGVTVPTPGPPDSLRADCLPADDHFWEARLVAPDTVTCDLSFMVLDRSCKSQGCFLWRLEATFTAAK